MANFLLKKNLIRSLLPIVLSYCALLFLWGINFNRVGSFYDYSIIIHGSYLLENGFKPHVDFHSPLPSLTIYFARLCEILFGTNFAALGIGNLLFASFVFISTCAILFQRFGSLLSSIGALAFVAAGPLQHSIIWYNSLGVGFLGILVAFNIKFINQKSKNLLFTFIIFFILTILGLIKTNYLIIGIFLYLTSMFSTLILFRQWINLVYATFVIMFSITSFFIIEIIISGASYKQIIYDLFQTPEGRFEEISNALTSPGSYLFSIIYNFYPQSISQGILLVFFFFFLFLLIISIKNNKGIGFELVVAACAICFLFCGLLNVVSNVEAQILNSSFMLICAFSLANLGFAYPVSFSLSNSTKAILYVLSFYIIAVSSYSIVKHSRILYDPDTGFQIASLDWGNGYLKGARMTNKSWQSTNWVLNKLSESQVTPPTNIFFGSSLEYFYRLTSTLPPRGLPLWWHAGVTWNSKQASELDSTLLSQNYKMIFSHVGWKANMPMGWIHVEKYTEEPFPGHIIQIQK
jgi:hypothetical protein